MNSQPPSGNPAVSEDLDQQLDSNFSPSQVNFNGQTSSAIYGVSCCVTGSVSDPDPDSGAFWIRCRIRNSDLAPET